MTLEVRRAADDDRPALALVMARAFSEDPPLSWVFRDRATRVERLQGLFRLALAGDLASPERDVLTTADLGGVAVWEHRRPRASDDDDDAGDAGDGDGAADFAAAMAASGFEPDEVDRMLTFVGLMGDAHPHDTEHWYLGILAADLDRQGQGIGSAVLTAKLHDVDAAGLPAYLESTNARNVPLYERHGFRVTSVLDLPDGPPLWIMWRDARR